MARKSQTLRAWQAGGPVPLSSSGLDRRLLRIGVQAEDGTWRHWAKPGMRRMTNRDIFAVSWQGGGGWGDPLERDPNAVAADVRTGAISRGAAALGVRRSVCALPGRC